MNGHLGGIGPRIAVAALAVATVAIAIVAVGVVIVGGQTFADLMAVHGVSTGSSQAMFDQSVVTVLLVAAVVAAVAAVVLAAILGRGLARPLREIGSAARRIAAGQYAARIPRRGPSEIVSLADSFNQMAAALEEQERLRREFIANAAHEIRTPLTNLKGYLEALRDGVIEPDRATFESLWEEAERLVRLSRSLDSLAEGDEGIRAHRIELDLGRAVHAAVDLVRPSLAAADLAIDVAVPEGLLVTADPDHVAQVLGNLLQNAVRYTPPGGSVTVRAGRGGVGECRVDVSNSDSAIPPADLGHVFERFYRVEKSRDAARGGAGIGLAIVQQLIAAAGGRVGAESVGGTTTFWFTLPAIADADAGAIRTPKAAGAIARR